jgi:Ca-activated chloride channel homolog
MTRRLVSYALTFLAPLLISGARAHAQDAPPQSQPPALQTARLRLLAYDDKGHAAALKRENVHVYVDGREQPVSLFEAAETPASYGLVVDNSGSLRSQIGAVVAAAQALADANGPSDETFVVRFVKSENIKILQEFTNERAALARALGGMYVEAGQTALLDAVYLSADYLSKKSRADEPGVERRRALVLVTDGEDRASFYNAEQVLKLLREKDVQVFAVGLTAALQNQSDSFFSKSKRDKAVGLLDKLTKETGGRVFYAERVGDLRDAVEEITRSLHTQYVVGYAQPPAADNKKHKVEVKASGPGGADKLKVVVRPERAAPAVEEKRKG